MKRLLTCVAVMVAVSTGCLDPDCDSRFTFDCLYDVACNDPPGGICLFDGETGKYCAFPDSDCLSGRRWGLARLDTCGCVAPELLRDMLPPGDLAITDQNRNGN